MPGFQINGQGGYNGQAPMNTQETRRKHRYYFETIGNITPGEQGQSLPASVMLTLKTASRPSITITQVEMDHMQETAFFAGKHKWEELKMSYYDVEQETNTSLNLWKWLCTVINFTGGGQNRLPVYEPGMYKADGKLTMVNGAGNASKPAEKWHLQGCWPTNMNWNDLDYSSSDICLIDVTIRYDRAYVES